MLLHKLVLVVGLQGKPDEQEAVLSYLPKFFEEFISLQTKRYYCNKMILSAFSQITENWVCYFYSFSEESSSTSLELFRYLLINFLKINPDSKPNELASTNNTGMMQTEL